MFRAVILGGLGSFYLYSSPNDLLRFGVFNNELRSVSVALMRSANPNTCLFGVPVFLYAVQNGYIDVVKELLNNHVNVNSIDHDGRNAMMHAAGLHHPEMWRLLLLVESNLDYADPRGYTVLDYAFEAGSNACIRACIRSGATISRALYGQEISERYFELISRVRRRIHKYRRDLNFNMERAMKRLRLQPYLSRISDNLKETILHKAVRAGNLDWINELKQINPHLFQYKNSDGFYPLDERFFNVVQDVLEIQN